MRVLLVEDDSLITKTIELALRTEGFICDSTNIGEDGLEIGKLYDYDLILLDLVLPDIDGYEVLRRLRASQVTTPVLIVSGLKETADKVKGLGGGADDYLTKPFNKSELLARMQAIVRRSKGHADSIIHVGRLSLNLQTRTAKVDDHTLNLTGKEYQILELLVMRRGSTLSKEVFLNHLYGGMDEPDLKIVDVFICKIRKKIVTSLKMQGFPEQNYIQTVWGRGYVLCEPQKEEAVAASTEKSMGYYPSTIHPEI